VFKSFCTAAIRFQDVRGEKFPELACHRSFPCYTLALIINITTTSNL